MLQRSTGQAMHAYLMENSLYYQLKPGWTIMHAFKRTPLLTLRTLIRNQHTVQAVNIFLPMEINLQYGPF